MHNLREVNSLSGFQGIQSPRIKYQNEMYDFYSILDEISVKTLRKAGFPVDLVRVGM